VEEAPAVAITFQLAHSVPLPTQDEAEALATARDYLTRAGTQVASRLLGCPAPDHQTALLADLSNGMLGCASLCAGLLELAEHEQRP
jgi:hypothetical protein